MAIAAARASYDSDDCVLLLCHACSQCFIHATGGFAHITHYAFSIFVFYCLFSLLVLPGSL